MFGDRIITTIEISVTEHAVAREGKWLSKSSTNCKCQDILEMKIYENCSIPEPENFAIFEKTVIVENPKFMALWCLKLWRWEAGGSSKSGTL